MKSIFSRLLLLSLSVLLLGFLVLTKTINTTYENYILKQNEQIMVNSAKNFEKLMKSHCVGNIIDVEGVKEELDRLDKYSDLRVWLVFLDGTLLISDNKVDIDLIKDELNVSEISETMKTGLSIFRESNYSSLPENQYYTLVYPIKISGKTFSLFLNKSIPNLKKNVRDINNIAFLTLIIVSIYSAITIFLISHRISRDIKNLNKGVKFVSDGNFDFEFNVDRQDEIGDLCKNLNSMTKELNNVEASRRKFISDLSHDLRSPITSIKGYSMGILDGTIPVEKSEKYLKIVVDESDRLTKLINDMLDLSKMQAGNLNLELVNFDINSMLVEVIDKFEKRIMDKDVKVEMMLFKGKLFVQADKVLIERAVYNLIDNAVKFVNKDGIIEILTSIKESKVLIGIRNTGTPIPADKLNTIWGRFSKLDQSRGMEKKSSGLGLSIVKEIIEIHSEKIDVFSNEELGVMFVFSLETRKNG